MPSSYTSSLRLTLPQTGELVGTWGNTVNNGVTSLVDQAVAGTANITMLPDATFTLSSSNGASDQARCMFINVGGGPHTVTTNVICPSVSKMYVVTNNTSGAQDIVFKTLAGTGVTIPTTARATVYCDGTNVTAFGMYGTTDSTISTFKGTLAISGSATIADILGIGTTSPVGVLHAVKNTTSGTYRTNLILDNQDQRTVISSYYQSGIAQRTVIQSTGASGTAPNPISFEVGNTEAMRITADGALQLSPVAGEGGEINILNPTGSTVGGTVDVSAANVLRVWNGNNNSVLQLGQLTGTGGTVQFFTEGTEKMRITAAGDVGIGVTTPFAKLQVDGGNIVISGSTAGGRGLLIGNGSSDPFASDYIAFWNDQNPFAGYAAGISYASSGAAIPNEFRIGASFFGPLTFHAGGAERARVQTSGNVGIGTTSPGSLLTVAGTIESTSGGVKYPDGSTQASALAGAKAWAIIYISDYAPFTFSVLSSYNISSVVWDTAGSPDRFVVTFSTPFSNANYMRMVTIPASYGASSAPYIVEFVGGAYQPTASQYRFYTVDGYAYGQMVNLAFFGS